jgi:hypothetical protein
VICTPTLDFGGIKISVLLKLLFTSSYTHTLNAGMLANSQETPPPSQSMAFLSAIVAATAYLFSPAYMDMSKPASPLSRSGMQSYNPVSLLAIKWMNSQQVAQVDQDTGMSWYIHPHESS